MLAESGIGKTVAEALGRAPPGSDVSCWDGGSYYPAEAGAWTTCADVLSFHLQLEMSLLLTLRELTNIPATNAAVAEAQMGELEMDG